MKTTCSVLFENHTSVMPGLFVCVIGCLFDVSGSYDYTLYLSGKIVSSCSVRGCHLFTRRLPCCHDVIDVHLTACRWLLRCCWSDYDAAALSSTMTSDVAAVGHMSWRCITKMHIAK